MFVWFQLLFNCVSLVMQRRGVAARHVLEILENLKVAPGGDIWVPSGLDLPGVAAGGGGGSLGS